MERLIYTDANSIEQGYLTNFDFNLETGTQDDFTLSIPLIDYKKIKAGALVFPEKAPELGGIVTAVTVKTGEQQAIFRGFTWLGFLKNVVFARNSKNIIPNGNFEDGQTGWTITASQPTDEFIFADGVFHFKSPPGAAQGERTIQTTDYIAVNSDSKFQYGWSARLAGGQSEPTGVKVSRYDAEKNWLGDVTTNDEYPDGAWRTWIYASSRVPTFDAAFIKMTLRFHHTAGNTTDFIFENLFTQEKYTDPVTIREMIQRAVRDCDSFINEGDDIPISYTTTTEGYSSYDVLRDFCDKNGYKIKLSFRPSVVIDGVTYHNKIGINLLPVVDYSGDEFSSELVDMEINVNERPINHAIGVDGIGTPSYTVIAERFMRRDGTIDGGDGDPAMYYLGKDMISQIVPCDDNYIIPTLDAVLAGAQANKGSVAVTVGNLDADVGDIVGGYDRASGLTAVTPIKSKKLIMTQNSFMITLET